MKRNSIVFIDASAWVAILDESNKNNRIARDYYKKLLEQNARLVTNTYVIDETLSFLKSGFGISFAQNFLEIVDESVLTVNLKVDWISRRVRRNAINSFLKTSNNLQIRHYYVYESIKRKKVDIVFSFDENLKAFDFPVMPQYV